MRYMILIHSNEAAEAVWRDGERATLDDTHAAIAGELDAAGELLDAGELSVDDVAVVGRHAGAVPVTRGPFTEGIEWVGGYYIVDVADRARAVEIAGRFAESSYSPIEIRRILHHDPID